MLDTEQVLATLTVSMDHNCKWHVLAGSCYTCSGKANLRWLEGGSGGGPGRTERAVTLERTQNVYKPPKEFVLASKRGNKPSFHLVGGLLHKAVANFWCWGFPLS